jgi:hypothetical protein
MTTKSLKDIVEYIQKYAVAPPQPPAGYSPSAPRASVPSSGTAAPAASSPAAGNYGGKNPVIQKMQEVLVNLAKDVTAQLNPQQLQSTGPEKQEAQARDSFADFFTKHYLLNSHVPAVEYSPDPTKTKVQDKDPRAPSKLSWVMDTMKRIGNTRAENFADGVWGPRTSAAIANAYALASGLLQLSKEMKVPIRSFSESNLSQLKTYVLPEGDEFSATEKVENAKGLIPFFTAIRNMYREVKDGVLENQQYQAYVEGDKPYVRVSGGGVNLTPQQIESLRQSFPNGFSVSLGDKGTGKIGIDNLLNVDSFKKWLAQYPDAKVDPQNVVAQIATQAGSPAANQQVATTQPTKTWGGA